MTQGSEFTTESPYRYGMLDVGDANGVYYELRGNPKGTPVLIVHGGPGSGSPTGTPKMFDPERYLVILLDQRGCGRSTPSAALTSTDMSHNTTQHLLRDMEQLRNHLGVDRWLLFGGSWGSGLAVEYAETHPERVIGLVAVSVWTMSKAEVDWLYRGGAGQLFPREWESFLAGVPAPIRTGDVLADYQAVLDSDDESLRERAALDWVTWEDAVLSKETNGRPSFYGGKSTEALLSFVRICSTYALHTAWREEGAILRYADRLTGIPGSIIHGRLDMSCPLTTAIELSRAWPTADLVIVDDAGHRGSAAMNQAVREAFARLS